MNGLRLRLEIAAFVAALFMAAGPESARGQTQFNARATINVTGKGLIPTETDYVPKVCRCENGAASFEALKAQAVAARTYTYYKMHTSGAIADGTSDQVYTCGSAVHALHTAAALATEGEILYVYDNIAPVNDVLIAAFYVAGAIPPSSRAFDFNNPTKIVQTGDPDGSNTERYVTYPYVDGLYGGNNLGSTLGFRGTPTNPNWPNRGAKSQNGADFLSDKGVSYVEILKYYYGADIQLRTAKTEGTGVTFGLKTFANFDNYGDRAGNTFGGNESWFNRDPNFSSLTTTNVATSTAARSTTQKHSGTHSQRINIIYDESSGSEFLLHHVAGARYSDFGGNSNAGQSVANLQFEAIGSVGLWLRTGAAGVRVSIAIDDLVGGAGGTTGERGIWREVIADNQWHKYQWFITRNADWDAWTGSGNGRINGSRISLDSIQFAGATDAVLFLDDVFWDPQAVFKSRFAGDFDGNGLVDASDYVVWRHTNGQAGSNLSADADDNGTVDAGDYSAWRANFGRTVGGAGSGLESGTVPEPATGFLLMIAGLAAWGARRCRECKTGCFFTNASICRTLQKNEK